MKDLRRLWKCADLVVFKTLLDKILRNLIEFYDFPCFEPERGLDDFKGSFQTRLFCESILPAQVFLWPFSDSWGEKMEMPYALKVVIIPKLTYIFSVKSLPECTHSWRALWNVAWNAPWTSNPNTWILCVHFMVCRNGAAAFTVWHAIKSFFESL